MIKQYYAIIMQSYKIKNRKKNEGRIFFKIFSESGKYAHEGMFYIQFTKAVTLQFRKYIGLLTRAKTKRLLVIEALL